MKKRRQRFRLRRREDAGDLLVPPGTRVTRDDGPITDPGEDLRDFSDYNDLIGLDDDPGDDASAAAWSDSYRVHSAVEKIEEHYRELARPLLAQQARNPGVRLPALVKLELECEEKVNEILRAHERAQALERAARRQPQQVATAHVRQLEQAAATAFARDLGRGRYLRAEPEPAGRDVRSTWIW
jgi:hypothetical protein